jgi:glucokinase
MSSYIAVDIGGTQIRAARYPPGSQTPEQLTRVFTKVANHTPLEQLFGAIASVWPETDRIAGIGIAAASPVDPFEGLLIKAPNIPGWVNFPLRQHVEKRFQVPVGIGNDANLAALGEWRFGAGRGHHHLIYFTVSTGIGGGVVIDDRLLLGNCGLAAELGHVTVLPDGPLCGCGQRGHLESVASGTSIARWTEQEIQQGKPSILPAGQSLTAKQIAEVARQGDELAIAAFQRAGYFMGLAIANYLQIFNPTIVIIGGGVSLSGDLLLEPLKKTMQAQVMSSDYLANLTLTTASLGDSVGLMGALALAHTLGD